MVLYVEIRINPDTALVFIVRSSVSETTDRQCNRWGLCCIPRPTTEIGLCVTGSRRLTRIITLFSVIKLWRLLSKQEIRLNFESSLNISAQQIHFDGSHYRMISLRPTASYIYTIHYSFFIAKTTVLILWVRQKFLCLLDRASL